MADIRRKHPANVDGPWFVDDTCIDCDATRQVAPHLIAAMAGGSAFIRQPETDEERHEAMLALLACPVGAVGYRGPRLEMNGVYPQELGEGIYYCGFNSPRSFGANAFFVRRKDGNFLIDSPRYVPRLAGALEAMGGIAHILLTHRDDVADADRYAERFHARVWIHEADRSAAPYATDIIAGDAPATLAPATTAIPVPGHTRGSVAYLLDDRFLFTGDSLCWSREQDDLTAFRSACWYSWSAQTDSLERLLSYSFEWVLAGHGDRHRASPEEMRHRLTGLVQRMRLDDAGWRAATERKVNQT